MHKKPTLLAAMTPFPHAIDLHAPVQDAAAMMAHHEIRHLPVTDSNALVGIVSARDLAEHEAGNWLVADVYRGDPYVVEADFPLEAVLQTMATRHLGAVIITRHGRLAGIMTTVDVCRTFAVHLRTIYPEPPDDEAA